jgi:murein DD-endopeptidase MepM/ murein hydrolase activator NlpD
METRRQAALMNAPLARRATLAVSLCVATVVAAAQEPDPPDDLPKYTVVYPAAGQFCPPVRGTFYEVEQTMMMVKGKRFRQQPNGGYGLPVARVANGKNLLHVGADLGWHQVGEPVFAVANGVVRSSSGPDPADSKKQRKPKSGEEQASNQAADPKNSAKPDTHPGGERMEWGNLVVIEHQTEEGEFFTSVYGHLATNRLVKTGEVVEAGQQIGVIGRQHVRVNGGYKPHLHFGVREGRMVEPGARLIELRDADGKQASVTIAQIGEVETEVDVPPNVPDTFDIATPAGKTTVTRRGANHFVPSRIFWEYQRPGFAIVGYSLSTDGWLDPIEFLKEHNADTFPAPFRPLTAKEMRRKSTP